VFLSFLARATFETPDKQFIDATLKGGKDDLKSVIENILINQAIPVGTGLPGLLVKVTGRLVKEDKGKKGRRRRRLRRRKSHRFPNFIGFTDFTDLTDFTNFPGISLFFWYDFCTLAGIFVALFAWL